MGQPLGEKALHAIAAIVRSFGARLAMSGMAFSPLRRKLFDRHPWAGVTILALSGPAVDIGISHGPNHGVADDIPLLISVEAVEQ